MSVCVQYVATPIVSDEAACLSLQPSVCTQETINKEDISWTIAARMAPSAAWELEEEDRRREGRLEEDEEGKEQGVGCRGTRGRKKWDRGSKHRVGERVRKTQRKEASKEQFCHVAITSAHNS